MTVDKEIQEQCKDCPYLKEDWECDLSISLKCEDQYFKCKDSEEK